MPIYNIHVSVNIWPVNVHCYAMAIMSMTVVKFFMQLSYSTLRIKIIDFCVISTFRNWKFVQQIRGPKKCIGFLPDVGVFELSKI